MLPHASTCRDISASWVPINVSHTVVVGSIHELQVGGQIFIALGLLSFKIKIPKVEIETLLRVDRSNDDKAPLW